MVGDLGEYEEYVREGGEAGRLQVFVGWRPGILFLLSNSNCL